VSKGPGEGLELRYHRHGDDKSKAVPGFSSVTKVFEDLKCSEEGVPFVTCDVASECSQILDGFLVLSVDHQFDIRELRKRSCQASLWNNRRPEHVVDGAESPKMRTGEASLALKLAG
jgi:hypothetical protein